MRIRIIHQRQLKNMKLFIVTFILSVPSFSFAETFANSDDFEFKKILFCQSDLNASQQVQLLKKMSDSSTSVMDVNKDKVTIYHLKKPIQFNQLTSSKVILGGNSAITDGNLALAFKESYKQVNKQLPVKLKYDSESGSYYQHAKKQIVVLEQVYGFEIPQVNTALSCGPYEN